MAGLAGGLVAGFGAGFAAGAVAGGVLAAGRVDGSAEAGFGAVLASASGYLPKATREGFQFPLTAGRRGQQTDPAWWQAAKRRVYRGILAANVRLFPGVDVLVRALHAAGLRLAVASSSWRENIHTVLDAAGLAHCFAVLTGKEDVRRHKPHPEPYLRTARALAVPPAACTVVEDSDIGIEAARRAGMRCIAIPNSLPPEQLAAADAILPSLDSPDAVLALLA